MRPVAMFHAATLPVGGRARVRAAGFTLFEMLVVLAILSIVATIGVPSMLQAIKKNPMRQAVGDFSEACQNARMMAILRGEQAELIIRPDAQSRVTHLEVGMAPQGRGGGRADSSRNGPDSMMDNAATGSSAERAEGGAVRSDVTPFRGTIPTEVAFSKLQINGKDFLGTETEARIRFYPNGTCDAFLAHLRSEQNEEWEIELEITTARESIKALR